VLTTQHPLSAKVDTNLADKRRSLGRYSLRRRSFFSSAYFHVILSVFFFLTSAIKLLYASLFVRTPVSLFLLEFFTIIIFGERNSFECSLQTATVFVPHTMHHLWCWAAAATAWWRQCPGIPWKSHVTMSRFELSSSPT
jgi:hypothetical protein